MKNYFKEIKTYKNYMIYAYQILGSDKKDPSLEDPIYLFVGLPSKHDGTYSFNTSVNNRIYGRITSRRIECKYEVGPKRFAFYDRHRRRTKKLGYAIARKVFPNMDERWKLDID